MRGIICRGKLHDTGPLPQKKNRINNRRYFHWEYFPITHLFFPRNSGFVRSSKKNFTRIDRYDGARFWRAHFSKSTYK